MTNKQKNNTHKMINPGRIITITKIRDTFISGSMSVITKSLSQSRESEYCSQNIAAASAINQF